MPKIRKIKILHITPHLGGGVGRVLLSYFSKVSGDSSFAHAVACLDDANQNASDFAKKISLKLFDKMTEKKRKLLQMVSDTDIILIHWWNHPLLYDFLVREKLPASRVIIWSHVAGSSAPQNFTEKILKYPDMFVFTTPVCLKTEEVKRLSGEEQKKLRVVWSTGGVEQVMPIKPSSHSGFNIGYIGTVDYAKLHPKFLEICVKINIPNAKFIVCGGTKEKELKTAAKKMGIAEKFNFTGFVSDITEYLRIFDVFGYPLSPNHYGTCDQSLQESMAAGVVPVVLANPMESYMIKNGVNGIVANNEAEYIKAIEMLYSDTALRKKLSKGAKEYANKAFSIEAMANEWDKVFKEAIVLPKTAKKWMLENTVKILPKDVFLEALGSYGEAFSVYSKSNSDSEKKRTAKKIKELAKSPNWRSDTKGTAHQYHSFFPEDADLTFWSELMNNV